MEDRFDDVDADDRPPSLQEFVASIEHLPLFTGMAARLVRSVDREDTTHAELAAQIAADPALVAQLLRMVNSPFYGLRRSVGTLTDAIAVLGFSLIRRIVVAAVLQRPLFAYLHDTSMARAFWRHQLLCAGLARHLLIQQGGDGEPAYMAGLLHDVGRLVMLVKFPNAMDTLLGDRAVDDDTSIERERRRFGFDHAVVGGALLEFWDVPEAIVSAAGRHVDEREPDEPLAASVWHANLLAHRIDDHPDEALDESLALEVGLTTEVRKRILDDVAALEGAPG